CWGGTEQKGTSPKRVDDLGTVKQLAVGYYAACALIDDGTVRCFGTGDSGELGDGERTTLATKPVTVKDLGEVEQVAGGSRLFCARRKNGSVWCWGKNDYGQIGDGTWGKGRVATVPSKVKGIDDAVEIAVGNETACARRSDASIACWGSNT